jgi:hypothetical protein
VGGSGGGASGVSISIEQVEPTKVSKMGSKLEEAKSKMKDKLETLEGLERGLKYSFFFSLRLLLPLLAFLPILAPAPLVLHASPSLSLCPPSHPLLSRKEEWINRVLNEPMFVDCFGLFSYIGHMVIKPTLRTIHLEKSFEGKVGYVPGILFPTCFFLFYGVFGHEAHATNDLFGTVFPFFVERVGILFPGFLFFTGFFRVFYSLQGFSGFFFNKSLEKS